MDLNALLTKALDALWGDPGQSRGHAAHLALTSLAPADLLGIIADCVSRLPHAGEGPGPSLELGQSAEAHALICELAKQAGDPMDGQMQTDERGYACVRVGGLWVGASRPRPEAK